MFAPSRSLLALLLAACSSFAQDASTAHVLMTIPQTQLVVEAVAHDPRTNALFISTINTRSILSIQKGEMRTFIAPNAGSLSGLTIDPSSRTLWACSTVSKLGKEYMRPDEKERAEVLDIDLDAAKVRRTIRYPEPEKPHFCDSVAVNAQGDLYITDSGQNTICLLPKSAREISKCVETFGHVYPQGVVPVNRNKLLVAGYAAGIGELDFAAESWRKLKAPPDADLRGIDGLSGYKNCLLGVQNGAKPARVVVMHLNPRKDAIESVIAVKTDPAELDEPTWGTVVEDRFVFIGNSQNETFRTKGPSAMKPTLLLEFQIPASCGR